MPEWLVGLAAWVATPGSLAERAAWATFFGLLLSLIGFGFTIRFAFRARTAAEVASEAATEARDRVAQVGAVSHLTGAITGMENLKRLCRESPVNKDVLFIRVEEVRSALIQVRAHSEGTLSEKSRRTFTSAVNHLTKLEEAAESAAQLQPSQTNPRLTKIMANLQEAQLELQGIVEKGATE
jgi:flagellar hook-basal body complex protein FliE